MTETCHVENMHVYPLDTTLNWTLRPRYDAIFIPFYAGSTYYPVVIPVLVKYVAIERTSLLTFDNILAIKNALTIHLHCESVNSNRTGTLTQYNNLYNRMKPC